MPTNNNDSRVKRTKKLIRQGIVSLAKTKSINKITVKELTDLIEINRGTFYLHYKDVYDLVESLEKELYNEFDKKLSSIQSNELLETPLDICEDFCKHIDEHKDLYDMLMGEHGDAQFTYKIATLMNEKIRALFSRIFPNMNLVKYDFAYNYGKFGFVGLVNCWFKTHPEWTARQVAEMWLQITTLGLWGIIGQDAKEVLLDVHNSR